MAFEVTIIDSVIEFVQKETLLTYILAFSTLALAIITGLSLWRTQKHTRAQLKQSHDEFKHKTRPILARHVHNKKLHNTNYQHSGDVYILTPEKILFHFINNGTVSATNIRKITWIDIHDYGFDAPYFDPKNESNYEIEYLSDLAPTEYYSVDITWNEEYFLEAWERKNCYFAIVLWYNDDNSNEYYYHMEGHFDRKMLMLDYVRTGILNQNSN